MGSDPLSAYKSTQVETASQEQILLMLYDGAIKFIKQARKGIEESDIELAHNKLIRAQKIVSELMSTLDEDIGGDIAEELFQLYDFILHKLVQANVDKEVSHIDDALPILEELHEAWDEIINDKGITVEKARRELRANKNGEPPESGQSQQESENEPPQKDKSTGNSGGTDQSVTYSDHSIEG